MSQEAEQLYNKTVKGLENLTTYFTSMLDKTVNNESTRFAKQRKILAELENKQMGATITVPVSSVILEDTLAELEKEGIVAAPISVMNENKESDSVGIYNLWADARTEEARNKINEIVQRMTQNTKTKANISPQSVHKVLEDLKNLGVRASWERNKDTGDYVITVHNNDAKALDKACFDHERMSRPVAPPMDSILEKHLKSKGVFFTTNFSVEENATIFNYAKSDSVIVQDLIQSYRDFGIVSIEDFNKKYENEICSTYTFENDIELNRFIDLTAKEKSTLEYAIDKNTILCKDNGELEKFLMETYDKLYAPGQYDKYLDAVVDAKIQTETINEISQNKNSRLFYASSENPNMYATLQNGKLTVFKVVFPVLGNPQHVEYRNCTDLRDLAKIGSCLAALGTPIKLNQNEFSKSNFESKEELCYKAQIDKTFKEHLEKEGLEYHHDVIDKNLVASLNERFGHLSADEIIKEAEKSRDFDISGISQEMLKKELEVTKKLKAKQTTIHEQIATKEVFVNLDAKIKGYGIEEMDKTQDVRQKQVEQTI